MYVDQIIDSKNKLILSWQTIKGIGAGSNKGRVPKWFEALKGKIAEKDGKLKGAWKEINWEKIEGNNNKFYYKPSEDKRVKEWCCFRDARNNIQWGKIKKKGENSGKREWQLYHYICIPDGQQSVLEECNKDCEISEAQESQTACTVTIGKENIFACKMINKRNNNHRRYRIEIPCNATILEDNMPEGRQNKDNKGESEREKVTGVLIEDWDEKIVKDLVKSKEYRDSLISKLWENKRALRQENTAQQETGLECEYEYYTDGSLIDRGIEEEMKETKMGAAWIQTKGPRLLSSFKCGLKDWPSSCRAEAVAILIALLVTPGDNKVTIITDSRSCIETFRSLSKTDPK